MVFVEIFFSGVKQKTSRKKSLVTDIHAGLSSDGARTGIRATATNIRVLARCRLMGDHAIEYSASERVDLATDRAAEDDQHGVQNVEQLVCVLEGDLVARNKLMEVRRHEAVGLAPIRRRFHELIDQGFRLPHMTTRCR